MQQTSRNKHLKSHLERLKAYAITAKSKNDIDKAAQHIGDYSKGGQYKFNNSLAFIALALAVLSLLLSYWGQMNLSYDQRIGMRVFSFVAALVSIVTIWLRYASIKSVGDQLYVRAVAINAGIERDYEFNGKAYWSELKDIFPLFNCGNEGHSITKRYLGGVDTTPFTLFEFKYVNVTRSSSTDSNGNSRTTTTKSTIYKYGMLVQFDNFNYLTLNAGRFSMKWDSASRTFNKLFKVRCASEIQAAKFFDPKVVLAFADKYHFIESMDVNSNSIACFELPKGVFPSEVKKPSLRRINDFVQRLKAPVKIPLLESSKELVQFINENK
ncbi:MAG: hypothetical protein ACI97K_003233 [Glaciecola sp.]|jgi:hypothetical protein